MKLPSMLPGTRDMGTSLVTPRRAAVAGLTGQPFHESACQPASYNWEEICTMGAMKGWWSKLIIIFGNIHIIYNIYLLNNFGQTGVQIFFLLKVAVRKSAWKTLIRSPYYSKGVAYQNKHLMLELEMF